MNLQILKVQRLNENEYEWMTVYPYSHRYVWTHWEGSTLKCNAYKIHLSNSLNMFNNSLDNWWISLMADNYTFINSLSASGAYVCRDYMLCQYDGRLFAPTNIALLKGQLRQFYL